MIGGGMSRYRAVDRCSRDYLSDYELGHAATVVRTNLEGLIDSEVPGSRGGARDKLIVFETMEKLSQPQKRADSAASRRYLRGGGEGVWLVHIHGLVGCGEWTMARMQEEWVMVGSAAEVAAFWSVRMCGEKETSVLRDVVDGDEFVCEVEQEVREWISRRGEGETEDRGVTFYSGGAEQACDGESLEVLARIHEVTGAMWRLAEERACGAH
ncbi:hypothetical protein Tco_1211225 [Tanacetum coccineum]